MPTRMQAVATCNRHNNQRMVNHAARFSISKFWQQSQGDFLLSGGSPELRQEILAANVVQCIQKGDRPVIIFSNSSNFVRTLVPMLIGEQIQIMYSSASQRNYHFFYGLSDAEIASCFRDLAEYHGYTNLTELHSYIIAFLSVLRMQYSPSLPAMINLADRQDSYIANLGRYSGVPESYVELLDRYATAGTAFRSLLTELQNAFSTLSDSQTCTELNAVVSAVQGNLEYQNNGFCRRIHLIDVSTVDSRVINCYIAGEIGFLLRQNCSFRLILNDVNFNGCDKLLQVLSSALSSNRCEVGVCSANPILSGLEERLLNCFYTRMILLDGSVLDPASLERLLNTYGTYEHWEPIRKVNAGWFSHPFADDWDMVHMTRARIRLEDINSSDAVVSGLNDGAVATIVQTLSRP